MLAQRVFALINNEKIENLIVCDTYPVAADLAEASLGKGAVAVDVSKYPVRIGDRYIEGLFYEKNSNELINPLPTEKEEIQLLKNESQAKDELILDNAYRVAVLEISTGATLNI